ncbi:MAG: dienelactone hydrolase family protein [Fimbriimonadales bacterium]
MLTAPLLAIVMLTPVTEQELSFKTTDGLELHGTFTEPAHAAGTRLKAVLMLPGSGPTDRNGNQPPGLVADTLKQMAEALAAKGIASYRFDKRAAHSNSAIWPKDAAVIDDFFAFEHFRDDAKSALETLKKQPSVDPAHVGMLGHSEGGLITIVVASELGKEKLPAVALLGTAGRSLDLVLLDQISALLHVQTTDPNVIKTYMDALQKGIDQVKATGTRPTDMPTGLQALFSPGTGKILQSYFTIDPAKTIQSYEGDVLLMQGEMDSQISVEKDFPVLKKTLESRKAGSLTAFTVPNASHNLKHVEKQSDPGIEGPVEAAALGQIVKWAGKL